jgi:hypothetical protein
MLILIGIVLVTSSVVLIAIVALCLAHRGDMRRLHEQRSRSPAGGEQARVACQCLGGLMERARRMHHAVAAHSPGVVLLVIFGTAEEEEGGGGGEGEEEEEGEDTTRPIHQLVLMLIFSIVHMPLLLSRQLSLMAWRTCSYLLFHALPSQYYSPLPIHIRASDNHLYLSIYL